MRKQFDCVADFVAFAAYADEFSQEPDVGDRVYFGEVANNVGGGYDNETSIFICPSSAFYYVYFHLLLLVDDDGYDWCRVDIVLNGIRAVTVSLRNISSTSICTNC